MMCTADQVCISRTTEKITFCVPNDSCKGCDSCVVDSPGCSCNEQDGNIQQVCP
jgi:hypothetical protein